MFIVKKLLTQSKKYCVSSCWFFVFFFFPVLISGNGKHIMKLFLFFNVLIYERCVPGSMA